MTVRAKLSDFGVPPLKVRRFASTIKGEPVERAVAILDLQSSPTCQVLSKLLKSAIANAQNNNQLAAQYLVVSNVMVDQGTTTKRIRPRARGRAYRILKRSCHVTIELDLKKGVTLEQVEQERTAEAKPRRQRAARSAGAEKPAAAAETKPARSKRSTKKAEDKE
jgi:large subunit ribosomal protein L22